VTRDRVSEQRVVLHLDDSSRAGGQRIKVTMERNAAEP
jgi:hypothetical protein